MKKWKNLEPIGLLVQLLLWGMIITLPLLMTNGGPNNATMTPVLYIYKSISDSAISMGYVLACSVLMMVFSVVFTASTFFLIKPDKSME